MFSRSINRRYFGQTTAAGFSSLLTSVYPFGLTAANASSSPATAKFRRCVVLWMEGGPSQLDTFDPKDLGPRESVATNVSGLKFADSLAGLAARADQLCVVRSVGSREGEHTRATELMHTGFAPVPSFPRPALGSVVSSVAGSSDVPNYVTLGGIGFGPAFVGQQHGPFVIEHIDSAKDQLARISSKRRGMDLLSQLNRDYAQHTEFADANHRAASIESVHRLLQTPFEKAIDPKAASARDRQRYGDHTFGQRVLAARELLKIGVKFVEVQLPGWDTHIDNQVRTSKLCKELEQPWVALMDDLQQANLWDDTLVVWMGEFGRTPVINGRAGRDHFPEATPVVLAGGNLGGRVIGGTNDAGRREGETHSVADLMATIMTLMGVDIDKDYTTDFGSPTTITDDGVPIESILRA